jgi:cytochrome b561
MQGKTMKNTAKHYGLISILIHWLVALVVFGLFGLGFWMVELTYYDEWYKTGPALHESIGICLFAVMLFRVYWRVSQVQPAPLSTHTKLEQKSGHLVHWLLYVLIFIIMTSGYMISTADERGIEVFGLFEVPGFGSLVENQEDIAGLIHQYLAYFMMGLVSLHAAGALKHHFIDKDKTLTRMLGKGG